MDVYRVSTNANGAITTHVNTESKRNVTRVFPPERSVKYEQWLNEQNGIHTVATAMELVARLLICASTL